MRSRLLWVGLAAILVVLLAGCTPDKGSSFIPAGRGELLASGKLWGKTWRIYCGVDTSADPTISLDPAPRGACAAGGHEHPCVQVDYLSGMILCQLDQLPQRLISALSLQGPDEDRLFFFGAVDATVVRVEFKLKHGPNLHMRLIQSASSRFKLFVTGMTREQGKLLDRPLLWDELGNQMTRKVS